MIIYLANVTVVSQEKTSKKEQKIEVLKNVSYLENKTTIRGKRILKVEIIGELGKTVY